MQLLGMSLQKGRTVPGFRLILRNPHGHLDFRFARGLPWSRYLRQHFRGYRTGDGWVVYLDLPRCHIRAQYHAHSRQKQTAYRERKPFPHKEQR